MVTVIVPGAPVLVNSQSQSFLWRAEELAAAPIDAPILICPDLATAEAFLLQEWLGASFCLHTPAQTDLLANRVVVYPCEAGNPEIIAVVEQLRESVRSKSTARMHLIWYIDKGEHVSLAGCIEQTEPEALAASLLDKFEETAQVELQGQLSISAPGARPLTDIGNAERLADALPNVVAMCVDGKLEKFHEFNGRIFGAIELGFRTVQILRSAHAKEIAFKAALAGQDEEKVKALVEHRKFAKGCENMTRIVGAEAGLVRIKGRQITDFDGEANDTWLDTVSGAVDLITGLRRPHQKERLATCICPTPFEPDAECPTWDDFLATTFLTNPLNIPVLQRYLGAAITGTIAPAFFPILTGRGANGKSVLMATLMNVLGADYVAYLPGTALVGAGVAGESASPYLASLRAKRLVFVPELPAARSWNVSLLKQLTGGEPISVRNLYSRPFLLRPSLKFVAAGNELPDVGVVDEAMRRRIQVIEFRERFVSPSDSDYEEKINEGCLPADLNLVDKLKLEAQGILNWLVQGARDYLEKRFDGLDFTETTEATSAYLDESDVMGHFLSDIFTQTGVPTDRVTNRDLNLAAGLWFHEHNEKAMQSRRLGRLLIQRGVKTYRSNADRGISGVRFKPFWLAQVKRLKSSQGEGLDEDKPSMWYQGDDEE